MSLQRLKNALPPMNSRVWWVIGSIMIILLAGLYVFFSIQAWNDLNQRSERGYKDAKSHLVEVLKSKASSESERTKKIASLRSVVEKLDTQAQRCEVAPLFMWQQGFQANAQNIKQCQSNYDKLDKLKSSLRAVMTHLDNEQETSKYITRATSIQQAGEADWQNLANQWANTEAELGKMKVAASFKAAHTLALSQAKVIKSAWQSLIATSAAKDRAKYEAALANIATNYQELNDISATSTKSLDSLVAEFELIYNQTF